jgi:hypothetical protein
VHWKVLPLDPQVTMKWKSLAWGWNQTSSICYLHIKWASIPNFFKTIWYIGIVLHLNLTQNSISCKHGVYGFKDPTKLTKQHVSIENFRLTIHLILMSSNRGVKRNMTDYFTVSTLKVCHSWHSNNYSCMSKLLSNEQCVTLQFLSQWWGVFP